MARDLSRLSRSLIAFYVYGGLEIRQRVKRVSRGVPRSTTTRPARRCHGHLSGENHDLDGGT